MGIIMDLSSVPNTIVKVLVRGDRRISQKRRFDGRSRAASFLAGKSWASLMIFLDTLGLSRAHPWSFSPGLPMTGQMLEQKHGSVRERGEHIQMGY